MATRNYYLVLGVPRGESNAGIRAAFRDLVKHHHPDQSGVEDAKRFREVVEASATVRIRIPPGVPSGSRFTAPLSGVGIRNLVLELLIRVGP